MKTWRTKTCNLPLLPRQNVVVPDAHTKNESGVFYIPTSETISEGFKAKDNSLIVTMSNIGDDKTTGEFALNCGGETFVLSLMNEDGRKILHTPSGTLSLAPGLMNPNSRGVRADLQRLFLAIVYRERGYQVSYNGRDRNFQRALREHRMLQKEQKHHA